MGFKLCYKSTDKQGLSEYYKLMLSNPTMPQLYNSTIQQFNNSTIQQFNNSTIQQFNNIENQRKSKKTHQIPLTLRINQE